MPGIAIHNKGWRIVVATVALPMYIVGSFFWIFIVLDVLTGSISPENWSLQSVLLAVFVCLLVFPLSVALLSAVSRGYIRSRVAISLLVPPPIMLLGVLSTPGNLSPLPSLVSALTSVGLTICLLRFWARAVDA
jgi:hypothetical protein